MSVDNNPYRQSNYLLSAHTLEQFAEDIGREVAFVGRSNVGKSSVINTITDQKRLAKTSKSPGRTRQINFFTVSSDVRLVDLPGYGFARVDQSLKKQWERVINGYFSNRRSLAGLMLIVDIRRKVTLEDENMLRWCDTANVPVHLILNKSDKLPFQKKQKAYNEFQQYFKGRQVSMQLFSVLDKKGVGEAVDILNAWLYP
ncbi:MAG: GTP-binding protein [Gammaproteobacteria bacterium]|jgi:GTP-binding protein